MRRVLILCAALAIAACTDPDTAREALLDAGYTNVEIGGYDAWACGRDDDYSTEFTATGPSGRPVRGVVCSSWIGKGATIRNTGR